MQITATCKKKHFLLAGVVIAVPFLFMAISNIIAAAPSGQYHTISELWIDSDINMDGKSVVNAGSIGIGTATPSGDLEVNKTHEGTINIGDCSGANAQLCLNDECFTKADLLAAGSEFGITELGFLAEAWGCEWAIDTLGCASGAISHCVVIHSGKGEPLWRMYGSVAWDGPLTLPPYYCNIGDGVKYWFYCDGCPFVHTPNDRTTVLKCCEK